jgi:hypothetical protein
MSKLYLTVLLLLMAAPAAAAPYPLGTMTCEDIGKFASDSMAARKGGQTREQAVAALDKRTYNDPVEKKNLLIIVGFVYGSYGNNWSVESAGNVLKKDCETGR